MGSDEGLTDAQLEAVPLGPEAAVWSDRDRALVSAVDEMLDHGAVGDATWDRLAAAYAPAQMLELLFVIGGYLCLATVLNSVGLRGELPATADGDGAPPGGAGGGRDERGDGATGAGTR